MQVLARRIVEPDCAYTIGKDRVISRTNYVSGDPDTTQFFLYDANANVDAVVNQDGTLAAEFTYDVFGAVRTHPAGDPGQAGFVGGIGHSTDAESGLVYMRARYYDPSTGRFISEDPGRNGTNWYAYCGNDPVNMVDQSGRVVYTWVGLAAVILLIAAAVIILSVEEVSTAVVVGVCIGVVIAALLVYEAVEMVEKSTQGQHNGPGGVFRDIKRNYEKASGVSERLGESILAHDIQLAAVLVVEEAGPDANL